MPTEQSRVDCPSDEQRVGRDRCRPHEGCRQRSELSPPLPVEGGAQELPSSTRSLEVGPRGRDRGALDRLHRFTATGSGPGHVGPLTSRGCAPRIYALVVLREKSCRSGSDEPVTASCGAGSKNAPGSTSLIPGDPGSGATCSQGSSRRGPVRSDCSRAGGRSAVFEKSRVLARRVGPLDGHGARNAVTQLTVELKNVPSCPIFQPLWTAST